LRLVALSFLYGLVHHLVVLVGIQRLAPDANDVEMLVLRHHLHGLARPGAPALGGMVRASGPCGAGAVGFRERWGLFLISPTTVVD